MNFTKKHLVFLVIFTALSLVANQINFSALVGQENQFFTLFQFFGPIAGAFLGPVWGVASVLFAQVFNNLIVGKEWTLITFWRLLPMMVAAFYFGSIKENRRWAQSSYLIPLLCMGIFIAHPVGRQAWFFSLYWLIPVIAKLPKLREYLFLRSLGATFTAHAVGGALWVWTVPMTAGQWIGLIPVVAYERLLFAVGIAVSYVIFTTVLDKVSDKWKESVLFIEPAYTIKRLLKIHA